MSFVPQIYLFCLRSVCGLPCAVCNPSFTFFLRPPVARGRKGWRVEPWVVGLITFLSLIVLAVCIGLTVHYVRYSKYELPWKHVIYPKHFLMYLPVLFCLGLVHSLLMTHLRNPSQRNLYLLCLSLQSSS